MTKEDLKPYQVENLIKLSAYLKQRQLKATFTMECFSESEMLLDNLYIDNAVIDCGSIGCAIGHGPYAGIEKNVGEPWYNYAERQYGVNNLTYHPNKKLYLWLFHSDWSEYDNTPMGAAKRIDYFLTNGLPIFEDIEEAAKIKL